MSLHMDEVTTDEDLVRRLVARQHPQWADLEVRFAGGGTDNTMYRLGEHLAVRCLGPPTRPRRCGSSSGGSASWGHACPCPCPSRSPRAGPARYPLPWSVLTWIDGTPLVDEPPVDEPTVVRQVAELVRAVRAIDPAGGPAPGTVNNWRAAPLALLDDRVRGALREMDGEVDVATVERSWDEASAAPAWDGPPVWVHGDGMPGNLLVRDGRLVGVLDVGCTAVGDPAMDVLSAWTLFGPGGRAALCAALEVDEPTRLRSRGWELYVAVLGLP